MNNNNIPKVEESTKVSKVAAETNAVSISNFEWKPAHDSTRQRSAVDTQNQFLGKEPETAPSAQGTRVKQIEKTKTNYMKKLQNSIVRRWENKHLGFSIKGAIVVAFCLCAGMGSFHAQAAPDASVPEGSAIVANVNTTPTVDTNSPVASIAADLVRIQERIQDAVITMSNAVASTPMLKAAAVKKLADQITELGTKDLGDSGEIVKQAESLIAKFNESVEIARRGASDPSVGSSARAIYGVVGPGIEGELAKLIDAKSTITRIRTELLQQAEGLRQSADAIGFAEHCRQLTLASEAFRTTLSDITRFTAKISALIQKIGNATPIPVT